MQANRTTDFRSLGGTSQPYHPTLHTTTGLPLRNLVHASLTSVSSNEIYLIGGFNQDTDEVFNHVHRLNLDTHQWALVHNQHGDIPDVRSGHTATLWGGDKLVIFGGENEHRVYHSDLFVFDLKSATWTRPEVRGQAPRGRARHAAVLHDEKLFIVGGLSGAENSTVLDDFCFLDLKTWEWSKTWQFTPRFDHACQIWRGKIYVFGGEKEWNGGEACDVWSLDLEPVLQYAAGTSPTAAWSPSSFDIVSGLDTPAQTHTTRFLAFSSGRLLDFATHIAKSTETSLRALNLQSMTRNTLVVGGDFFDTSCQWHYCVLNPEGTQAWLLGCPVIQPGKSSGRQGSYLSHFLSFDLKRLGLLGNSLNVAQN